MKNIHILPTDKPSRLYKFEDKLIKNDLIGLYDFEEKEYIAQHFYITSDEDITEGSIVKIPCGVGRVKELHWKYGNDFPSYIVEDIFTYKLRYGQKEGELQTNSFRYEDVKKIILTTDVDLIQNGVQKIDDDFLLWFLKNPSCEEVEVIEQYRKCCRNTDGKNENCIESINCEGWLSNEYERPYKTNCDKRFEGYKIIIPKEEIPQVGTTEFVTMCESIFGGKPKQSTKDRILSETSEETKQRARDYGNSLVNKKETPEEAAENYAKSKSSSEVFQKAHVTDFMAGYNLAQKKLYSEEEVMDMFHNLSTHLPLHYEFLVKEQFKNR